MSEERPPTSETNQINEPAATAEAEASAPPEEEGEAAAPEELEERAEAAPRELAEVAPQEGAEAAPQELAEAAPQELAEAAEPAQQESAEAEPQEITEAAPEIPEEEPEPLPERYEVDEIVGMAVDPETLYLYWEVQPTTLARARATRPDGQLVIRMIAVLPTWEGPMMERRDIAVDALFGDRFVRGIPAGANVRLSIGWLVSDGFEPFAVGLEIAAPRAIRSGEPPRPPAWLGDAAGAPHGAAGGEAADRAYASASGTGSVSAPASGTAPASASASGTAPASASAPAPAATAEGPGGPERFRWEAAPAQEPLIESWSHRGGASELTRPGGASELTRPGGASDLARSNGAPPIESWFIRAGAAGRPG